MHIATDRCISIPSEVKAPNRPHEDIDASLSEIEIGSSTDAIDALAPEWLALQRLSGPSAVFQNHAQIRIWARHFLHDGSRLHVALVRKNGYPVLILPLVISGPPYLRIARLTGDPIAQYSEILVDPAADIHTAFRAAFETVKAAGADAIVLRRVRADSNILALANPYARLGISPRVAPYAELSSFPTPAAYLESLSKNMRKGLRNRRHHLAKAGDIRFQMLVGGAEARNALADAIALKRRWLIDRGEVSAAILDPHTRDCLLDFAGDAHTGAVLMRLTVNGETAAIRLGFEHLGTHFAYLSAYDERSAHLAPGKMLMDFCISMSLERGLKRIDMLPPGGRHKSDWCRSESTVADYTLPLTPTGHAYAKLYQEHFRPALRRTWQSMPGALRSLIAARIIGF